MAVCRVDTSEGVVIAVAAVMALTVYLVAVGLDMGDELVGVGGLFPAAGGLALSIYGPWTFPPREPEP